MRVLLVGANGLTGQRIAKLLVNSDHDPVAMIRNGRRLLIDSGSLDKMANRLRPSFAIVTLA